MPTTQIQRHIVTKGNLGMVAAGTPIFVKAGNRLHYNVQPGQLVAYLTVKDGSIPVAIAASDIDKTNIHRLRYGVGHSTDGRTVDAIRYHGAEEIGNCDVEAIDVASPRCGNGPVEDFYFECTNAPHDTYTIAVGIDDNFTRSHAPLQASYAEFIGSYTPARNSCVDCGTDVTCDEVINGLIDSIKQDVAPTLKGKPYPDYHHFDGGLPFGLAKIHPRSLTYCLSLEQPDTECENCSKVTAITKVNIGGTDYDLLGTSLAGDPSQMARVQIQSVADQINELFEEHLGRHTGSAFVKGSGINACCPLQIIVNTSDADFAIYQTDGITELAPTEEVNPFGAGQPGEGFTCGIRVMASLPEQECGPYMEKPYGFTGRKIRVEARGEGFSDSKTATIQELSMPAQFGGAIQYKEVYQDRGGSGRGYSAGYQGGTWNGAPNKASRIVAAPMADCHKDYCSYHIRSRVWFKNQGSNQLNSYLMDSYIHVPSSDETTIAAVVPVLQKWADLSMSCTDPATTTCTPLSTSC